MVERFVRTITRTFCGLTVAAVLSGAAVSAPALAQQPAAATTVDAATQSIIDKANAGATALREGRLDESIATLSEVISANALPPHVLAAAHYHRGIAYQKKGRYNQAAADYTTALWLEELPEGVRARAHYNRGTALDNLGQQARAKDDFDKAIELEPEFSPAYNNRGNVLRRLGQYEAAIRDYDASIALGNPLPHLPLYGRAAAREALGDTAGARGDLKQALEMSPDYTPAKELMASLPQPSTPLAQAAEPQAIDPATTPTASLEEVRTKPVETAQLPPPAPKAPEPAKQAPPATADIGPYTAPMHVQPRIAPAPEWPLAADASADASSAPAEATTTKPEVIAETAAPEPVRVAEPLDTARSPAVPRRLVPPQTLPEPEARITTASSLPADAPITRPTASEPATSSASAGSWTTRILPANSREVRTLTDSGPALKLKATETQVAVASPQPVTGYNFPGVATEPYRTAARPEPQAAPARRAEPVDGGYAVQLASFRSENEAEDAWRSMLTRLGDTLAGRDRLIQRADIPGKGTYYRLRVGPMAGKNAATALCSTLKSQGQDCYVAKL